MDWNDDNYRNVNVRSCWFEVESLMWSSKGQIKSIREKLYFEMNNFWKNHT